MNIVKGHSLRLLLILVVLGHHITEAYRVINSQLITEQHSELVRHKRTASYDGSQSGEDVDRPSPKLGIPGLPDPATILKVVQVVQNIGSKVIPALIEAFG